jgi:hypothetical protein
VNLNGENQYCVCPNGHGRLWSRYTKEEFWNAWLKTLPDAKHIKGKRFRIEGRQGEWLRDYKRKPLAGYKVKDSEAVAVVWKGNRRFVRVFTKVIEKMKQQTKETAVGT